jgi:hypothetical protein
MSSAMRDQANPVRDLFDATRHHRAIKLTCRDELLDIYRAKRISLKDRARLLRRASGEALRGWDNAGQRLAA